MADLINRDDLMRKHTTSFLHNNSHNTVTELRVLLKLIHDAPTIDAIPIVRCKDCKHANHDTKYLINLNLYYCVWHDEIHNPNWYCPDGEQKKGEQDED